MVLASVLPLWVVAILVAVFFFVCLMLILAVLIQRPQGGGLSGAFGSGAGSGQTAFGAKTGDALTVATIAMFVLYLAAAIGLNFALRDTARASALPAARSTQQGAPSDAEKTETPEDAANPDQPAGDAEMATTPPPDDAANPDGQTPQEPSDGQTPAQGGAEAGGDAPPTTDNPGTGGG